MNDASSRSHAIFSICIQMLHDNHEAKIVKIDMVDLAGFEALKQTNDVKQKKEGTYINQGLSTLSLVVGQINKRSFISYRNHKLTHTLKNSIGGNAITLMIICVSPSSRLYSDSVRALNFAKDLCSVVNKPVVNKVKIPELNHELLRRSNIHSNEATDNVSKLFKLGFIIEQFR